jgi:predicted type IV restriction endonuclease
MPVDIRKALKKYVPHLTAARDQNLNEADTVQRLVKVFEDVLGYDSFSEITREMQIKERYVDLAIKVDGAVRFLVEAKSAATDLRDRHIEQAERYASKGNIRWVLLTNGVHWNLYHLTFEEGIEYARAFQVNVSDNLDEAANCLALLHRNAIRKGELDDFWAQKVALAPVSIGRSLFHEDTLRLLRRDIRRREGLAIDEDDMAKALHEMLSVEARELIGPVKIRRTRAARAPRKKADVITADAAGDAPHEMTDEADS